MLQNQALRCLYKDSLGKSNEDLHKRANLFTLPERRNVNLLAVAHARKFALFTLMGSAIGNGLLRSGNKRLLNVPFANNAKFEKSFVLIDINL